MMHEGWAIVCVVGFWGWVFATIGFILKAFPSASSFSGKIAAMWGGVVIICYLLWFMGMLNT
jgi:hypothetical protein